MIRVLHLASFSGNIGDNANHMGFRPWFETQVGTAVNWTNLEIREFYWKERSFDQAFVDLANSYDALVIGGGNYFELWVESSPTGTSIAIEPRLFAEIKVPVLFNALGVDPGLGVPETSHKRFKAFLDQLLSSNQYLVSVRNDGAIDTLNSYFGQTYAEAVHHIPDGGFFMPPVPRTKTLTLGDDWKNIGINVANDIADVRYAGHTGENKSAAFAKEFARAISASAAKYPDIRYIFFPHIFRDIDVINQTILELDDRLRRTRILVAPYGSGDEAANLVFGMYQQCDLVLGTRFHSNVCAMAAGVPTIGLNSYRQIEELYKELGLEERLVDIGGEGFEEALCNQIDATLAALEVKREAGKRILNQVFQMRDAFSQPFQNWAKVLPSEEFKAAS